MLQYLPELTRISSNSEFAVLEDVYENVGCHECIPSYVIKKMVMTLMVLDGQEGRNWNVNDIPDLVVTVFMAVNDIKCRSTRQLHYLDQQQKKRKMF